jgi:hypothetical protein
MDNAPVAQEWTYPEFVDAARSDERVLGLVLTGSRGRGYLVRPDSDWDVRLVVRDEQLVECEERFDTPHGATVEVAVFSLSQFEQAGGLGTRNEWDRYSYVHAEVVLDKTGGEVTALVAEKSVLPAAAARDIAGQALDGYVNALYRSVKNHRIGLSAEAHLDAAESLPPFLTALFAMHERVRPFNKFLAWELEAFPLGDGLWSAQALVPRLEAIVAAGLVTEQQSLFRDTERFARERGLGHVIDGWEPDVDFLRGG